jgi:hypothetical protein
MWWKKLFFHVFNMAAHILDIKTKEQNFFLVGGGWILYERVVKGLPTITGTEIQVQGQTISLFGKHCER